MIILILMSDKSRDIVSVFSWSSLRRVSHG